MLPIICFALALPAVEAPSDVLYFYGGVFSVVYVLLAKQESTIIYFAFATLPLLFVPAICQGISKKVPFWLFKFSQLFAIANGCIGLLIMYGRWY
jgi:hypothetical protein